MSLLYFEKSDIRQWLPKLQSHRGYRPTGIEENTLASVKEAYKLGYKMVEFDVRLTADGVLILHHDPSIESALIQKTDLEKLKTFKSIDTLEDVFKWLVSLKDLSFKLNVELKSRSILNGILEKKTCQLILKYKLTNQIMISSFNPLALSWVRFYTPKVYRALLLTFEKEKGNTFLIKKMILNRLAKPHVLNLRYQDWVFEKFAAVLEEVPVVLWTCNDLQIYKENKDHIYGIISDEITPQMFKDL